MIIKCRERKNFRGDFYKVFDDFRIWIRFFFRNGAGSCSRWRVWSTTAPILTWICAFLNCCFDEYFFAVRPWANFLALQFVPQISSFHIKKKIKKKKKIGPYWPKFLNRNSLHKNRQDFLDKARKKLSYHHGDHVYNPSIY